MPHMEIKKSLYSWTYSNSTLQFYFMPNKFNSVINFQLHITDECGNPQRIPVQFVIDPVPIQPLHPESFMVYPVPAQDIINISSSNSQNGAFAIGAVLYDMFGQEKTVNEMLHNNSLSLDVAAIPEGIYLLKIIDRTGTEVIKHISIER